MAAARPSRRRGRVFPLRYGKKFEHLVGFLKSLLPNEPQDANSNDPNRGKPEEVKQPEFWNNRRFNQPEQPVVGVSWDEAVAFAKWAQRRLPTDAEWEYACRAGSTTEYCFDGDLSRLGDYAWFGGNSNGQTQPVGTKKPNAWGLHEMHGNVWEWCQDYYSSDYYNQSPKVDPTGPAMVSNRGIRGAGWFNDGPAVSRRQRSRRPARLPRIPLGCRS